MKISELKTGYQFLQKPKPDIKDYFTWAGPFILFFINIWNKIYKRGICPYTHSFTVAWENGVLVVYEAVSPVYRKITFEEKLKEVDIDRLIILIPQFEYNNDILIETAECLIGVPYDYRGLSLSESVYQLTDERLWIGTRNIDHSTFCTKACAYLKFKSTLEKLFAEYFQESPDDLYTSILFKREFLEL